MNVLSQLVNTARLYNYRTKIPKNVTSYENDFLSSVVSKEIDDKKQNVLGDSNFTVPIS